VVKRLLRQLEVQGKAYHTTPREVFDSLANHAENWKNSVSGSKTISNFKFLYIPGPDEKSPVPTVLASVHELSVHGPVDRPSSHPLVSPIAGIRSSFCFRVVSSEDETLAFRRLSCHCGQCLENKWDACTSDEAGEWTVIKMTKIGASSPARLRSERSRVSQSRRNLAKLCQDGEFVALESMDDEGGFAFWLAQAKGPAFQHIGQRVMKDGVQLKPSGWYLTVTMFDRFPASSSTRFQSCQTEWTIDAEGLVVREVVVQRLEEARRTRSRSASSASSTAESVCISDAELERIETHCAVRLN
jgi:hypothetical protein